jgi:hypothetical protein
MKVTRTIYADIPAQLAEICRATGYIRVDIWRRYGAIGTVGKTTSAIRSKIVEKRLYENIFK